MPITLTDLENAIRNVADFPRPGIQFKDITPVLGDAKLFAGAISLLVADIQPHQVDAVVGIDARGFILGGAVALQLGAAFVPVRKKGKLPYKTVEQQYDLEYGSNTLAMHVDALKPNSRVLLVDDLLATGGTAWAASVLVGKLGGEIIGIHFMVELGFLHGRAKLKGLPVKSLVTY